MQPVRGSRFAINLIVCTVFAVSFCASANAQSMTCGVAVNQLQGYVVQVNSFANAEYYQGIPMRCGANPQCMQWWLVQLNAWYAQQTTLVNGWYQQIVQECGGNDGGSNERIDVEEADESGPGEMDDDAIEDLEVDDEDKTVRIRIPSTPKGFQR